MSKTDALLVLTFVVVFAFMASQFLKARISRRNKALGVAACVVLFLVSVTLAIWL